MYLTKIGNHTESKTSINYEHFANNSNSVITTLYSANFALCKVSLAPKLPLSFYSDCQEVNIPTIELIT